MRKAARILRGGAEIRVTGAEPWRFADRCAAEGLYLEDVTAEDLFTLRGVLRWGDLPRAEKAAVRCGCTLEVTALRGAPALWRRLRRRWLFAAAGAFLAAGLFAASLFVWDIRVTENDSEVPDAVILRVLAEQGVGVGAFFPGFHADLIRSRALAELPELSWLAVNVRGGRASVEVRRTVEPPEIWDPRRIADVTAARSGVITELFVLEGTPQVKRGDAVEPGQILISADRTGIAAPVHARGEVTARTWYELTAAAPLSVYQKTPKGGEHKRFALILGRHRINFYRGSGILPDGYDKITGIWEPGIENVFSLPMAWVTERLQGYTLTQTAADPETVRRALEARLLSRLRETLGEDGEILSVRYSVSQNEDLITVTLRAECSERIDKDTPR